MSTANERETVSKCYVSNLMKGLSEKWSQWKKIISAISCVKVVTPEKSLSPDGIQNKIRKKMVRFSETNNTVCVGENRL